MCTNIHYVIITSINYHAIIPIHLFFCLQTVQRHVQQLFELHESMFAPPSSSSNDARKREEPSPRKRTGEETTTPSKKSPPSCVYCTADPKVRDQFHYSNSCYRIPLSKKLSILDAHDLCHLCFANKSSHVGECRKTKKCRFCEASNHHPSLCINNTLNKC